MKKILWLTTIKPSELNIGGPSGLPWEIIRQLKQMGYDVTVEIFEIHNPILVRLSRLGFFPRKCDKNLQNYERIMVYPDCLANYVPHKYWNKTISMGPDASSFVMARMYRIASGWRRWMFYLYMKIQLRNESSWLRELYRVCVVGKNDKRWLQLHNPEGDKARFLVHPFLSYALNPLDSLKPNLFYKKRFVFAGDLSRHYVGSFFEELASVLKKTRAPLSILVVGKRNKWVYDSLKTVETCDIKYISWVDDYRDVCVLGQDIHCVPIFAGGGTKNRVLTALANGLQVITTPIGLENIYHTNVKGIRVCRNANMFVDAMMEMQHNNMTYDELEDMLQSRKKFRDDIDEKFKKSLGELLK